MKDVTDEITRSIIERLSDSTHWPLDRMSELLEEAGITHPRPREVLRAYFTAVMAGNRRQEATQ